MAERGNRKEVSDFSSTMIHDLERCLRHPRKVKFHTLKERMWEKYFKLRASDPFRSVWANFVQKSIGMNSCPIFYQYVTDKLMESLIKEAFVGYEVEKEDTVATYLDCEESNALHYTAGFVLHSLAKTFIKSRLPNKDELLLCIREMTQGKEPSVLECAKWTELLDRGGLIYVSDDTCLVFAAMETVFRKNFVVTAVEELKRNFMDKLLSDEMVLSYWSVVSMNWCEDSKTLLQLIAEKWMTIRGYSSASAFVEQYKRLNKKTVQKSKGLRKTLLSDKCIDN